MTVEQPALHQRCHTQPRSAEENYIYAQIKEITGVDDERVIRRAITACQDRDGKYEIENVVTMLLADDFVNPALKKKSAVTPVPSIVVQEDAATEAKPGTNTVDARSRLVSSDRETTTQGTQDAGAQGVTARKSGNVIDLTNESASGSDLHKAIVASLQDTQGILGGQVSREEQDISRVLEQSLAESKAGTKRKRGDIWFVDPLNPHERKRQDDCPVGLKNVGNTCWFSAVIQSLFHIRRFRHLVLNFHSPNESDPGNGAESRNLRFMTELRYLFGLMIGSHKKYVDPSKAVEILKEAFSSSPSSSGVGESQQDVSEFQHKLLEWLEDAFKADTSCPSSPEQQDAAESDSNMKKMKNPMVELFYGQYRAEGTNEGKGFSNDETFGQFPLQVNGFRDVHESLEAATAPGVIETISGNTTQTSGQELWFTRLPPVLTFELSRFQFNQQLGRPEKIHNKIEFPQVIYMDRYMCCNKIETRHRREQVKKLREELSILNTRLNKFNHYGSGSKKVPLQDVLSYALEFAQSKPDHISSLPQDVEMESPKPQSDVSMVTESSPVKSPGTDVTMTPATPPRPHRTPGVTSSPAPRHITDGELQVLQDCLHRWRTEVEQDVRELQDNINILEENVNKMYSDDAMQRYPYQLHAVLVHEGQAASGHYWAYIYNTAKDKWLKFNDITVSEASWDELAKESVGGYHNASAYCLMYVDKSQLQQTDLVDTELIGKDIDNLPKDLKESVILDNKKFEEEILDWDNEQARKAAAESGAASEHKPVASTSTVATQTSTVFYPAVHASLSVADTAEAVASVVDKETFNIKDTEPSLVNVIECELKRVDQVVRSLSSKLPMEDPRLQHPLVYLTACNAGKRVCHRIMCEQVAYCGLLDSEERYKALKNTALRIVNTSDKLDQDRCRLWHEKYDKFRKIVYWFVQGVRYYNEENYEKAMPYFLHIYEDNRKLLSDFGPEGGLSKKLLMYYRRHCMLKLNTVMAARFEEQDDVTETLQVMNTHMLPCLQPMTHSSSQEDTCAMEVVREKWCAFLGQEISARKIEKLQDFMSKLFDPPNETRPPALQSVQMQDLRDLYRQYINVIECAVRNGSVGKALNSQ
ncbi:ubiquitin carboxyl-terminal hydrolase 25-like isoform X1 [Ylistrum balloti]|uniref:ubiquitin carboxyl-terminal hydrolase 25-like isoform X1 n=1 Tax=Ylistrum balloti TaxID=509963 RepID=UPI0029059650|nr:ubiquitin carboxyl-terminal hydrolase 25-like isoform X1 [Ylistrum balloti]